jgi:RNA polymerase sigma-70 factor (ECF subfamily)
MIRHYTRQRRDVRMERQLAVELDASSRVLENVGALARESSPSQQIVRRERAVFLAESLQKLPADYREVLILRHLEGLDFAEVAARMQRSVDSVKKLWARALARLRAMGEPS